MVVDAFVAEEMGIELCIPFLLAGRQSSTKASSVSGSGPSASIPGVAVLHLVGNGIILCTFGPL